MSYSPALEFVLRDLCGEGGFKVWENPRTGRVLVEVTGDADVGEVERRAGEVLPEAIALDVVKR
jgi:hypothetical protein